MLSVKQGLFLKIPLILNIKGMNEIDLSDPAERGQYIQTLKEQRKFAAAFKLIYEWIRNGTIDALEFVRLIKSL